MATRQIKMPQNDGFRNENHEAPSQRQRPESGRYLLQVDRQTKGSYPTAEGVQSAALVIKKSYPVVQVSVYDRVGNTSTWWSCRSAHPDRCASMGNRSALRHQTAVFDSLSARNATFLLANDLYCFSGGPPTASSRVTRKPAKLTWGRWRHCAGSTFSLRLGANIAKPGNLTMETQSSSWQITFYLREKARILGDLYGYAASNLQKKRDAFAAKRSRSGR